MSYLATLSARVAKQRKERNMQNTLTRTQEQILQDSTQEASTDKRRYSLLVKFLMSNTPLLLKEGTHPECLKEAKLFYEFMKREHGTHGTGIEFTATLRGADTIVIMGTPKQKIYGGTRLWCTFEIREKVERTMYDKPMGEERPLVATDKQPALSPAFSDSDLKN